MNVMQTICFENCAHSLNLTCIRCEAVNYEMKIKYAYVPEVFSSSAFGGENMGGGEYSMSIWVEFLSDSGAADADAEK